MSKRSVIVETIHILANKIATEAKEGRDSQYLIKELVTEAIGLAEVAYDDGVEEGRWLGKNGY